MNATQIKDYILAALAALGTFVVSVLGAWDGPAKVLVALMLADYATGIVVAALFKRSPKSESGTLDSRAGFKGIVKKCAIVLLVFIATLLDKALGTGYVRVAVMIFFIGNEGISLLENVGLMGVPYPRFLRDMLQALRDRGDEGTGEGQ